MTLLSVNNIQKTYQKAHKKAVSDVSFNVDSGDIVAFLGPNGAGKTTTLKIKRHEELAKIEGQK